MTPAGTSRRTALAAGGVAALVIAGCGKTISRTTPEARRDVASGLPGGELQSLKSTLVLEHAQLVVYEGARELDPRQRRLVAHFAAVEREHIAAVEAVIRRQGGVLPRIVTPPLAPASGAAALARCEAVERTAAAGWLWFAQRAVGLEVRAATVSILGVELRQRAALRGARGVPMLASCPPPAPLSDAVAALSRFATVEAP